MITTLAVATVDAASTNVHVGSFYIEDASIGDGKVVVAVGDQLRFVFDDSGAAGKRHAVEVTELGIYSGPQPAGAVWVSPVLKAAGTFQLVCRFHKAAPNNHYTTLIVTGATVTPAPTPRPTPRPTPTPATTPRPTPTRAPGTTSGAVSTPTRQLPNSSDGSQPGGSALPSLETVPPSGVPDASSFNPDASAPGGELPVGGDGPGPTTWLRSVWVWLLTLAPIAAVASLVALRELRRGRGLP